MNVGRHIAANLDELREVQRALDEEQLQAVVTACLSANRIYFSGMGRSETWSGPFSPSALCI